MGGGEGRGSRKGKQEIPQREKTVIKKGEGNRKSKKVNKRRGLSGGGKAGNRRGNGQKLK